MTGAAGYFDDAVTPATEEADESEDFDFDAPEVVLPTGRGASEEMERYFAALESRMRREYELARLCREKGLDPETRVEIPPAIDLAARVEELVGPKGVADRIRELSKSKNREELSLIVAKEAAAGKFGPPGALSQAAAADGRTQALDQAIRTGLAILTEGILVAPLEGIAGVRVLKNDDGTDCVAISFAGPIRAAGGTGQALSVLIADVVRRELGIGRYQATEREISRMKEEIPAYKAVANLQYKPSNEEIELIMRNCPVMIDGEGTEKEEIGGNRDLPRIETNQIRGGACLVLAEGMTQKAPKIQKNVKALKLDGWEFIDTIIELVKKAQSKSSEAGGKKFTDPWAKEFETAPAPVEPSKKYLEDLIAGRPVFSYPSRKGGWRLRYGRSRTGGLATTSIHPAAMSLTDDFLAAGTQMKIERPGKATACTPCDSIEPPIALLANGNLVEVTSYKMGKQLRPIVSKVIDLGELLVPYGEFAENNKTLPASPFCDEWWAALAKRATGSVPDLPTAREAVAFAERSSTPLHPRYNLFWHDVTLDDIRYLSEFVEQHGTWRDEQLHMPKEDRAKAILVELCALHEVEGATVKVGRHSYALVRCLGLDLDDHRMKRVRGFPERIAGSCPFVSALAGVTIKPRAMYRIGTRMGRPEKAAERKMNPPVHLLFPIETAGGSQRLLSDAAKAGKIEVAIGRRDCPACRATSIYYECERCGGRTTASTSDERIQPSEVDVGPLLAAALARIHMDKAPETVKAVQGLVSKNKSPEPIEKGLLRAKHGVFTFKDGTVRFDMINITLTHFKPRESNVSVEKLKELGYQHDVYGAPLERDDQIVELRVQDVIVSTLCMDYMLKAANFVDELLSKYYGYKPYYNCKTREDLYGHLFVALAPHTSGGVLCRIIGHNKAQAHYGHPYFHAAKRRNCFRGDTEILVWETGTPRKIAMKDLVDPLMKAVVPGSDGMRVARVDAGTHALSLDPRTGSPRKLSIVSAIQGTTREWVTIETSTHRSFTVTPDHRVLVRRGGELVDAAATEVAEGDQVPIGMSLPREPVARVWNVAEALAPLPEAATLRIRGADEVLRARVESAGRDRVASAVGASQAMRNAPARWFRSFPVPHFATLVANGWATWDDIPTSARIAFARDDAELPSRIETGPDLARLVGFYLAEGHARSTPSAHQLSWRVPEPTLSADVQGLAQRVFGREPIVEEGGTKVTLASRAAYLLFVKVWGLGKGAHEKRVPSWAFELTDALIAELLAGFFDGDGSALAEPPRLRLYSASRLLLDDLGILLQALGIFARFVRGEPRPPGSFFSARYEALGHAPPPLLDPVHAISLYGVDIKSFAAQVPSRHPEKVARLAALADVKPTRTIQVKGRKHDPEETAHALYDRVVSIKRVACEEEPTYCIDVDSGSSDVRTRNVLLGNGLYQIRCDGDEDCLMLLMDGLLNFSRSYLPTNRGGLMDAPLTLTMRVDPSEVDKEAHNVDVAFSYPLEFYEATLRHPGPKDVEKLVERVADRLGKPSQYEGFGFTHDTADIADGPAMSAYKTIGSMMDKMDAQLDLAARIRAVDAPDVAARIIGSHFLPDLMGNLKAFSKQGVRCTKCGAKYRRIPLSAKCRKCGNATLTMTVYEASVKKYLEVTKVVSEKFDIDPYVRQRIEHVEDSIESTFSNDRVKKAKLSDFF